MIQALRARRVRYGLVVAFCAACLLTAVPPARAVDTSTRSAAEIQSRWRQLKPVFSGSPYLVAPTLSAPFAAGSLNGAFLQDGLNSINYARYLAGLPDDVVLDSTYTDRAQHGAVLLAVGQFAHSQPQPATMDTSFYTIANNATSSSNIGWGYSSLWDFNISCMGDEDTGNIDRVGHRRWLLNPPLKKVGMGMASSRTDTWVFDWSRTPAVTYDSVKWPCAGPFPVEMLDSSVPWSITLNPTLYSWTTGTAGHTITLRRERDGKVWTFTSADTNKSGEYFNFETSGYGVSNCFIFRPDPASVGGYQAGDAFDVTLTGGVTNKADGTPATISYRTQFMSQAAVTLVAPGTLAGTVSAGGSPLAGVSISVPGTATATTGANGTYSVAGIAPGTYNVTFAKSGYVSQTLSVTISSAATTTKVVAMTETPAVSPVFRFYNKNNGSHFYTASEDEKSRVRADLSSIYTYEGVAYTVNNRSALNASPLYRFYNKNNGSHFYTASLAEKSRVQADLSATYAYDGPAYNVCPTPSGTTVWRFYNKKNGSHFYTASSTEKDNVIKDLGAVYALDGPGFYIAP